jgi:hypothetical protein
LEHSLLNYLKKSNQNRVLLGTLTARLKPLSQRNHRLHVTAEQEKVVRVARIIMAWGLLRSIDPSLKHTVSRR